MDLTNNEEAFAQTEPGERILLLPQCLRPSKSCPGKFGKEGLVCPEDCVEACVIPIFRREIEKLGYRGMCIAAGGKMALRYVMETHPKGIVAVACPDELEMGVDAVEGAEDYHNGTPAIVIVPLTKDGCVDTEVDPDLVVRAIDLRA